LRSLRIVSLDLLATFSFMRKHYVGCRYLLILRVELHRVIEEIGATAQACKRAGRDIHDAVDVVRKTRLGAVRVPLAEVRDVLGHTTVAMTERYAHLAPENLRAAVAALASLKSRFGHGTQAREEDVIA
jgi:integrase